MSATKKESVGDMKRNSTRLTLYPLRSDEICQLVDSGEKDLNVTDESLGHQDPVHVGSIAHMQEHIGNAGGR